MPESVQSAGMVAQFGKYLLDAEIGRGGMARVYLARLRGLGGFEKRLVVKQVLPELARDPRFVQMFVDEAKTLVQMSHPHIVPVYELGVVDGVYFLAMEHVEGATLAQMLKTGPLDPGHAAFLGVQICDALHYAHTRFNLVHRDVTPRNIIVDGAGHARLIDFGIAAPTSGAESGGVFGSPGYMSPEHILSENVGPRSDLFSLGAVLFEALTGTPAFLRATDAESRKAVLYEDPPTLRGRSGIPVGLAELVDQALRRAPEERPESAAHVGRKLRGLLAQLHPEGIAPEVGARAEAAMRQEPNESRTLTQADANVRRDPSRQIRTIATSHALTEILEGHAASATNDGPRTVEIADRAAARAASRDDMPAAQPASTDSLVSREPWWRKWGWVGALAIGAGFFVAWESWTSRIPQPLVRTTKPAIITTAPTEAPDPSPPVLDAAPPEPPPAPPTAPAVAQTGARLSLNAKPWALATLDGRPAGETPIRGLRVAPGDHVLELECPPLGKRARVPFRAEATGAVTIFVDMTVDPPGPTIRLTPAR